MPAPRGGGRRTRSRRTRRWCRARDRRPADGPIRPAPSRPPCPPGRCRCPATPRKSAGRRAGRARRTDHARPDLTVRFGGVAELHLVVRRSPGRAVGSQRNRFLVHPGAGIRHEELTHVGCQPGCGLGVVGFGAGIQLLVQLAEHDAGVVGDWWRLTGAGRSGDLAEQRRTVVQVGGVGFHPAGGQDVAEATDRVVDPTGVRIDRRRGRNIGSAGGPRGAAAEPRRDRRAPVPRPARREDPRCRAGGRPAPAPQGREAAPAPDRRRLPSASRM